MIMLKKALLLIGTAVLLVLSSSVLAAEEYGQGNSDLNILNGGTILTEGEDLYFNQGGIFLKSGDDVRALSPDDGRNLNLWDGMLYYTVGEKVFRLPGQGGAAELVHTAPAAIKQLYVVNGGLRYIAGGRAYEAEVGGNAVTVSELDGIIGFIPTRHGSIFLTGKAREYTVWAGDRKVFEKVQSCYTDSGYLAVQKDNENFMIGLEALFGGSDELEDFDIHGNVSLMDILEPDSGNAVSEDNENTDLMVDFDALLREAGFEPQAQLMDEGEGGSAIPEVSQGQRNIVKRARQLHEIKWTPLEDRTQWGGRGTFEAETTYTGIPYGQPVNTNGYVGYGVSLDSFESAVLDNTSRFYSEYSQYNKTAPVYSTDCSGFVSYAWGLGVRKTTYSIPHVAELIGQNMYSMQVGDCLDKTTSHVVLVADLSYDKEGNIVGAVIMEQTPVITKLTKYGQDGTKSLASLQSYYLNGGYSIYRYPGRNEVSYTPSPVVPLDGEVRQKDAAPTTKTGGFVGGKTVELFSEDPSAVIYYTTDGSEPNASSNVYSGALTFSDTTKLRAVAVSGNYQGSTVLNYTVRVSQLDAPTIKVDEGLCSGQFVSSGSKISISSVPGAKIYFTTDGSEPTTSSAVYSSPITVNSGMTIKAMALASGYKQSKVSSGSYEIGTVYTINASAGDNGGISPSGEVKAVQTGSMTFKLTPKSGYKVAKLVVDGADLGERTEFTFSDINADHSISVSFAPNVTLPFADVSSDSWCYDAVCYVYGKSLYKGITETYFGTGEAMTRGMFVTVLGRYAGVSEKLAGTTVGVLNATDVNIRKGPSTDTDKVGFVTNKYTAMTVLGEENGWYKVSYGSVTGYIRADFMKVYANSFSDLDLNSYYSHFAQWAYLTGVSSGTGSGNFNGGDNITREDMCVMLRNFARAYGRNLPAANPKQAFSDDASISATAKEAVYALQQAGVINGMGDGTFAPKGTGTRAQVAQIFKKFDTFS